jgi:hypothetical protein
MTVTRKEVVLYTHHLYTGADSLRYLGCNQDEINSIKKNAVELLDRDRNRRQQLSNVVPVLSVNNTLLNQN